MKKINIDDIEIFVEDADQYLQINDICGTDLGRIWAQIKTDYERYDKWFCYHNNVDIPLALLDEIGAILKDNSIEMLMNVNSLNDSDVFDVMKVTAEFFDEFAAYHDERNPEMYWTSERIRRDLSNWGIFMLRSDTQIVGYILLSMWNPVQSEIFCVEASTIFQCELLITFAVKFAFDNGRNEVLYMADDNTISQKAALSVGFPITGFYKGYMIKHTE